MDEKHHSGEQRSYVQSRGNKPCMGHLPRDAPLQPGGCVNTRPAPTIEPLNLWQSEKIDDQLTNTTRRGFLSTAAALATSVAVAIPANAFGADPIFEAIEVHRPPALLSKTPSAGVLRLTSNYRAKKPVPGLRFGNRRLSKRTTRDGSIACVRFTVPPMPKPTPLALWQASRRPRWRG